MSNNEQYKEIDYFGVKLLVSKEGEVIWNNQIRKPYLNKDGYLVCSIKLPNIGWRSVRVHRLVAIAYIPNPNNLPEVNHKDYNRQNPHVNNLEWISRKDNVNYSNCNRPDYKGEKNPNYGNHKLSEIYAKNKELAKIKQGRPKLQNGRCRKIKLYIDNKLIKEFDYIVDCCIYIQEHYSPYSKLESIRCCIDKSVRENRSYKNMYFVKE